MSRAFLVNGLQLFFVCSLWFMLVLNAGWDFLKSNQLSIALVFGTYMTVWLWSINRVMTNKLHSFDIALSTTVDYCFFIQILLFQYTSSLVVSIVTARGGIIDKFMSDGILVHFGAVSTSSTYAADALISIEEILYKSEI
jgi:hypothetical protein